MKKDSFDRPQLRLLSASLHSPHDLSQSLCPSAGRLNLPIGFHVDALVLILDPLCRNQKTRIARSDTAKSLQWRRYDS
jgi:hypothetical protein